MNLEKILADLKIVILKAGKEVLEYYDQDFENEKKENTPVTDADLASEKIILNGLKKYKDFGILSEESSFAKATDDKNKEDKSHIGKEWVFVVDPLDGTKDFVHKIDDFSVLIALLQNNIPILGLIYHPIEKKLYYAIKGSGAFFETDEKAERIEVSKETDFEKMRILMSMYHQGDPEKKLAEKYKMQYKHIGSAGLKLAALAAGQAEIYINSSSRTAEWDTAAGQVILEEAGGKITDNFGNDLEYNKEHPFNINGFIATNNIYHQKIVKEFQFFL